MTKEEAIQKAYGKYWESVRIFVDHSGWLELIKGYFNLEGFSNFISNCDCTDSKYFRPKSLQGIEDNNGWIRIESEEDLPKETIQCSVCFFDGKNYLEGNIKYRTPELISSLKQDGEITHYKLIEKPKPPVY